MFWAGSGRRSPGEKEMGDRAITFADILRFDESVDFIPGRQIYGAVQRMYGDAHRLLRALAEGGKAIRLSSPLRILQDSDAIKRWPLISLRREVRMAFNN